MKGRYEVKAESRMNRDMTPSSTVLLLGLALPGVGVGVRVVDAIVP
jgi:hypothetical protein